MEKKNVIIGGGDDDPHAKIISRGLREFGVGTIFVDTSSFSEDHRLCLTVDDKQASITSQSGQAIELEAVQSVWYRRTRYWMTSESGAIDLNSDEHFKNTLHGVFSLNFWEFLSEAVPQSAEWVNPLISARLAENKLIQLMLAAEVGLTTCKTHLTNDPRKVAGMLEDDEEIICKSLVPFSWREDDSMFNNLAAKLRGIGGLEGSITQQMALYQPYVEKSHELRATIIGRQFFVTRINSQSSERGSVDWRGGVGQDVSFAPDTLDEATKKKILALMDKLKIVFATCDFIVTPDGELVFVELNQAGNFLWQEEVCPDLKLASAMSHYLSGNFDEFTNSSENFTLKNLEAVA